MQSVSSGIQSERLVLVSLSPEFLRASLREEVARVETLLGLSVPADWFAEQWLIKLRLAQLEADPGLQPWLLRAIGLRETGQMVGHIGFHTAPGPAYLREIAPEGIEYGYTVYSSFRRQGYAREASETLMSWAHTRHAVNDFVVTIAPDNQASRRLSESLGFVRVGDHIDAVDGLEYIYKLRC